MARCEDYPCCGHDICPDYDESGRQINMKCTCGATVPLSSRSSLCEGCLADPDDLERDGYFDREYEDALDDAACNEAYCED